MDRQTEHTRNMEGRGVILTGRGRNSFKGIPTFPGVNGVENMLSSRDYFFKHAKSSEN